MSSNAPSNPYAPPRAAVSDPRDEDRAFEQATRASRLLGALVDIGIGGVIMLPLLITAWPVMLAALGNDADPERLADAVTPAVIGGAAALTSLLGIAWLVVTYILVKRNSQTIGKRVMGIKVVRSDGSRASLSRILWLRNVVNWLPGMVPFVGNLYPLIDHLFIFGGKQQCVHDLIADTIVVKV
jgi:uncharacterized RDD family membrane protein YckC